MVPLRLVTFIRREVGPALLAGTGQTMLVMLTIIPRMQKKVSEWLSGLNSLFHAVEVKHGRVRATSGWVTLNSLSKPLSPPSQGREDELGVTLKGPQSFRRLAS